MTHTEFLNSVRDMASIEPQDIDSLADHYGKSFAQIKTNQIRNVFASIQDIRARLRTNKEVSDDIRRDIILLKPKVAYIKGRFASKPEFNTFYEMMKHGVDATVASANKEEAAWNFIRLVEALVAYHRFYGGK